MVAATEQREAVFSLFLFLSAADQLVTSLGAVRHDLTGSDEGKLRYLQLAVAEEHAACRRFPVPARYQVIERDGSVAPGRMTWEGYQSLMPMGFHLQVFAEVFAELGGAPQHPLCCITAIVDGVPRVDDVVGF